MRRNTFICLAAGAMLLLSAVSLPAAVSERDFAAPPAATKPWVYWYWISDNISREGITRDLEAMARAGIGRALIGNIYLEDEPIGKVKVLSEEWWGMVEHAIREGKRLGVDIGLFNCPGWSQSGGPWIKPGQSMRYVTSTETHVKGPLKFQQKLPSPAGFFQDIAVLAFPAPQDEGDTIAKHHVKVNCTPRVADASKLADGDLNTTTLLPRGAGGGRPFVIDLEAAQPFTARSLRLFPAKMKFGMHCELQAQGADGQFKKVRDFTFDRTNDAINVGPMPYAPVAVAFPVVTAQHFRLVLTAARGRMGLAEIELSGAARLESYIEKQLGKMHPTPQPMWDTYLWPPQAEPESRDLAVAPEKIQNLTSRLAADGTLTWDVPAGEWIILRTGMTPTGTKNSPASPEGQGLEVDKMNRQATRAHFDAYVGQLLRRMPAADRTAFTHVVADSYEMGSENWTDGFAEDFQQRYGYDPRPWLAVMTGRIVGSADQSDRFLWDVRRLVADRISRDYVGGLREAANKNGLKLWLENYGHWGYPGEFLQYGGQSDCISGEFWATGNLGSIELRCASSCANTYGKPVTSAEAFTGGPPFISTPWSLKRRGDWAWCDGINHFVLHVYIHQPWDDRKPGINAPWGTEFNRHNTWLEPGKAWIDYLRRSDALLQQGKHVADIAYFIGEDTPKMTGTRQPELPPGYDFDYINADVIQNRLAVKDGRFVLPDGMSYRLLVLPPLETMRPELLAKIKELVAAGGHVMGSPPRRSPSMQRYPACDEEIIKMAAELWGAGIAGDGSVRFGQGSVTLPMDLKEYFDRQKIQPDLGGKLTPQILWTHRAGAGEDIYFLANQDDAAASLAPLFRVQGRAPELWYPVTGRILKTARFEATPEGIRLPLTLAPRASVFVVFRELLAEAGPTVAAIECDGRPFDATVARLEGGKLLADVPAAGQYRLAMSGGGQHVFEVRDLPAPATLAGPWEVRFPKGSGAPEKITFDKLVSWTERPEATIRYFSGTAAYRKTFAVEAERLGPGRKLYLVLEKIGALAEVIVNGKNLGVFWTSPARVEITDAARAGANTLEIRVTNPWLNRLLGDRKYPGGLPGAPAGSFKPWLSLPQTINPARMPLEPAGLIGSVTLVNMAQVKVE